MRKLIAFLSLLLPFQAWAECPPNKSVIAHLKEIHSRLVNKSSEPIEIDGKKYTVHPGKYGETAVDLLSGEYRGFTLNRLAETSDGSCPLILKDDKTPTQGAFFLKPVP